MFDIVKDTPINFKVAKVDYSYRPSPSFFMEAGVKGTLSEFFNEVEVTYTEDGFRKKNPELSVTADLDEKITAAYMSAE